MVAAFVIYPPCAGVLVGEGVEAQPHTTTSPKVVCMCAFPLTRTKKKKKKKKKNTRTLYLNGKHREKKKQRRHRWTSAAGLLNCADEFP